MRDDAADRAAGERWRHDDLVHAWWVEPGAVLAGEYPGHRDPRIAERKVDLLVDAGVRTFVDLTTAADGLPSYADFIAAAAAARYLDLRRHHVGIPDMGVADDATYDALVALIRREAARGVVYVHCWGGIGRTGTVVGCLLADQGLDYDAVVARLEALRAGTRKADRPSPEAASQHDVLRRRASGRDLTLRIGVDDPRAEDVRALVERHLTFARADSPPCHAHALEVDGLLDPAVTFFTARHDGVLLGIGALKQLDETHGELKSMHTAEAARRRGVGRAMLDHLLAVASARGYGRVSLETGTMDSFAPARTLYAAAGFTSCAPFGSYTTNPYSACMTLELVPSADVESCEACGFVWESVSRSEVAPRIEAGVAAIGGLLAGATERVGVRPSAERWSALEYAAHVRDVLLAMRDRFVVGLVEDVPAFTPMYRDQRVDLGLYRAESVTAVTADLHAAAAMFVRLFEAIDPQQLDRAVQYAWPEPARRSLLWVGQQVVHEVEHHRDDIAENLSAVA